MRIGPASLLVLALGAVSPGLGQEPPAPREGSARRDAVVLAVERAAPGVVNIATERVVEARFGVPDAGRYLDEQLQGRVARPGRQVVQNLGSGVVVDPGGFIVTNAHVVARASRIMITLPGGKELEGELLSLLADEDLALVKVEPARPLPALRLAAPGDVHMGETCIALGNPFGLENTVTRGVVSARGRRLIHQGRELPLDFLQTDAAINPGNSGGALINLDAELIGINTAVFADGQRIGFAIPVGHVRRALARLSDPLLLRERWLGAELEDSPGDEGALVLAVQKGGPAEKAGLKPGDRIVAAGPERVSTAFQLHARWIRAEDPGPVRLSLVGADGVPRGATLAAVSPPWRAPIEARMGFVGRDVTPAIAWRLGLPQAAGIHVDQVSADSPAAAVGLKAGDVLIKIARKNPDGFEVRTAGTQRELGQFLAGCPSEAQVVITIRRKGRDYWGELRLR